MGSAEGKPFIVVDTGGLDPDINDGIFSEMARQTQAAIAESDAILFITDARDGVTAHDRRIAEQLRRLGRRIWLVVNKAEGMTAEIAEAEFHELGFGAPEAISSAHGHGIGELIHAVLADFPSVEEVPSEESGAFPKVAVVGRPNVGKSTLINALLGEDRVIAFDQPGTTRDSIEIEFEHGGKKYTLIDTAGVRRKGKVFEAVEKFSVIKTLQAIDEANVVVLVLDAQEGISEQDAHLAGFILERGRALVVAVNKWDAPDDYHRDLLKRAIARKLRFLSYSRFHYISAKKGEGVTGLLGSVDRAYLAAMCKLSTPKLTRVLIGAVSKQQPPRNGTGRPKLRFAHQGGQNPPVIIIHGSALSAVPESYTRYLESEFRSAFKLEGTPLRVEFRSGKNPYV
jgi:GTP-binding protein